MNNVILMGRLATEPAVKTTKNGKKVCVFTLAVRRRSAEDKTDFIRCQAWEKTAEFVAKYFAKGRMIALTGRLQTEHWEDNGQKKSIVQVAADNVYFTGEKAAQREDGHGKGGFVELDETLEEDLPF